MQTDTAGWRFYENIKGGDQRDDGRGQAGWRRGETQGEQES